MTLYSNIPTKRESKTSYFVEVELGIAGCLLKRACCQRTTAESPKFSCKFTVVRPNTTQAFYLAAKRIKLSGGGRALLFGAKGGRKTNANPRSLVCGSGVSAESREGGILAGKRTDGLLRNACLRRCFLRLDKTRQDGRNGAGGRGFLGNSAK